MKRHNYKIQRRGSNLISFAVMACSAFLVGAAYAAGPWYVDVNNPNAADTKVEGRGSEALPFKTIQAALDNSSFEVGDTVYVKPGIYNEGGKVDGLANSMSNRVYITKKVHLKATGNKSNTFIVGRHATTPVDDMDLGIGTDAIRCVCVKSASGTVIEGFTLMDGATASTNNCESARGGGIYVYSSPSPRNVYLVDCDVVNCMARAGGGMYGGVAVRCLFDRCGAWDTGAGFSSCWGFACVVTGCLNKYPVTYNVVAVNCTIALNKNGVLANSNTSAAYNCVIAGNEGFEYVGGKSSSIWENSTRTEDQGKYQVFSPATFDWRLVEGADAIGLGTTNWWSVLDGIPKDYLKYDYAKNEWMPDENGMVNAGAVQAVANAAAARIEFSDNVEIDGRVCTSSQWLCSDVWPVQYHVRPIAPEGSKFYCYSRPKLTDSNWEPTLVYPETNGTLRITPPPAASKESITYTAQYAGAEIWVDPSSAGSDIDGDGTETAPYQTLQKAVDSVETDYTIIHARRGEYASGGNIWSNLLCRVDFYTGKNDTHILLRAEEGPEVTAICGASDMTKLGDAGEPGCGPDAARCVLLGHYAAIQGFTLKGGRTLDREAVTYGDGSDYGKNGAAVYQNLNSFRPLGQILDCVVTNCIGVNSVMFWGYANRCRLVGNVSRSTLFNRGVQSACLVHNNTCLGYLNNNTYTFMSTFAENAKHADASEFINWYGASYVYDSVFVGGAVRRTAKADIGNFVWLQDSTANLTQTSVVEDPFLASPANGDFRPFFYSPVIGGCPTDGAFYAYVGSDFTGGPLAFTADGKLTAGCFQSGFPSAYVLTAADGSSVTNVLERGCVGLLDIPQSPSDSTSRWWKGSVELHEGSLDVHWGANDGYCSFSVSVAGTGTLAVMLDGDVLDEVSASDGAQTFRFTNGGNSHKLGFVFSGSGTGMLSEFQHHTSFRITVR